MKATHTARLKNFNTLFELDRSLWPNSISALYLKKIAELAGEEFEVRKNVDEVNHYYTRDISIPAEWLTDIKPIKPIIEVPETPFWFTCGDDLIYHVILRDNGNYKVSWDGREAGHQYYGKGRVSDNLNKESLTWTIVPKPEPVTRPWTDEEWREWFLNDGVLVHKKSNCLWKPQTMNERTMFYFFDIDEQEDQWYSKKYICKNYTDRHGNPFTKLA
jgi:hypothetical protein